MKNFKNTNRSMNEHFIIQLSEQLGSIVWRAKLMALPLTVADALPLIANRGQIVFGFDDATKTDFEDLISKLLKNNKWSEKYSERFLSDQLLDIIAELIKDRQLNASQACIKKLVAGYESFTKENVVFIPIGGIALNLPELVVGNIKFRKIARDGNQEPFARLDSHIANTQWTRQHEEVKQRFFGGYGIIICAEFRVVAEPHRAEERAIEECNRVLELLRYSIPSLYKDFQRVEIGFLWEIIQSHGAVLTVESLTPAYHCSSRIIGPATLFEISETTLQALESLGIFQVGKILQKNQEANDFEKAILRAIHWHGTSVSQTEIENKFLNLLISIESLLTPKEREPIANAIAEGVAFVLGDDLRKRLHLKKRMKQLYGQRSGLSHGGSKEILESDLSHLQDIVGKLLVWAIRQVDKFKSHAELFDWIEEQKLS
jgi:hypothetical protein